MGQVSRREFPRAVKVACVKRATRENVVYYEECALPAKKWQIDHIDADGLTGKPTLENAKLLCIVCHRAKTKVDVAKIAKAKAREASHIGATRPKATIQSRGFNTKPKREAKATLPPRAMFARA